MVPVTPGPRGANGTPTSRWVLPSMACVLYEKLQPEGKSLEDYVRESEEGIQKTLY